MTRAPSDRALRFAYADPPYLGVAEKFYGHLHPDAADYDDPTAHEALIERMTAEFDGWAMSLSLPSLRTILPMCPPDARIGAWVKPFASFKKNVTRAWAWEPIILWGGRPIPVSQPTQRDWIEAPAIAESITLRRGFTGAKPAAVCRWIFDWLNMRPDDEFVDLFPGSGAVTEAYHDWLAGQTGVCQIGMFATEGAI
ncbi:hypothetical protein G432_05020 [Sphingomonas sp. MM-1]|uniref:hypothetical protein n=1 Tax=Sphingomonas sp. MM-1 TaxID=745310 RepID=UPI0002C0A623|nr:hypothetical protein [Sphingomonas sp. MM-1]AGH48731.1 hypothetical protein G432_05020 [Sphingomonas sp. MM-1]